MNKEALIAFLEGIKNESNKAVVEKILGSIRDLSEENLQKLIEKQGLTTPENIKEYFSKNIEEKKKRYIAEERQQDEAMFKLERIGMDAELQVGEQLRNFVKEEQNEMRIRDQINLRILDVLGKIAEQAKTGQRFLVLDVSFMKDLSDQAFEREMKYLQNFGFEMKKTERSHEEAQRDGRAINEKGITRQEIEQGTTAFAIPFDKVQSPDYKKFIEATKQKFAENGKTLDGEQTTLAGFGKEPEMTPLNLGNKGGPEMDDRE